ncbi:MAG: hypothetical protein H7Y27_02695 [Gemmatimonadaceae bacterium]|nr:hypothetical protein [Chitinophagaceae bacterium]
MKKFFTIFLLILIIGGGIFFYWRFYFVFGEGTKAGQLNFFVRKGYMFKTFEGRLILPGYKSQGPVGGVQSNEFEFSVVDDKVAAALMSNSGAVLELHYKEYLGAVPWRGMNKFIVDSVISIKDPNGAARPF